MRDYTGAMTLLEFKRNATKSSNETLDMWIGYCAFHAGEEGQRKIRKYEY